MARDLKIAAVIVTIGLLGLGIIAPRAYQAGGLELLTIVIITGIVAAGSHFLFVKWMLERQG